MTMTYSDDDVAALYDVLNPWGSADDFFISMIMKADAVLDVGCGTGVLLREARQRGHSGRLCGIDPDKAMLDVARGQTDVEWRNGTAASMDWSRTFDLAVMSGHAFQFLVTDDDLHSSLAAVHRALVDGGRFVFETRNPLARAWTDWDTQGPIEVLDPKGRLVHITYDVETVVDDVVTLTETTSDRKGTPLRIDRASMRFLSAETLAGLLTEAGFQIEAQYGDWTCTPFTSTSPEMITIVRRNGQSGIG